MNPASTSSSSPPSRKARLLGAVRRSFTIPIWRSQEFHHTPPFSVDESWQSAVDNSYDFDETTSSVPTVEQIARGLHLSRTPHIYPTRSPPTRSESDHVPQDHLRGRSRISRDKPRLNPPPVRSALKSPGSVSTPTSPTTTLSPSFSSMSTSSTSTALETPRRNPSLHKRLRLRMSKMMPSQTQQRHDDAGNAQPTKKFVRFSSDTDRASNFEG